jgi:hypothetical protein
MSPALRLGIALAALVPWAAAAQLQQVDNGLTGHVGASVNQGNPQPGYQHGFSLYATVYTLIPEPSRHLQLGAGSWIIPDNRDFTQPLCPVGTLARDNFHDRAPVYRDVYQTLEGGVGLWGSVRFPSSGPKFRVNGVPDCYNSQMGAPGFSFQGDALAANAPGLAQIANRLLLPPDGVPFAGTHVASLFGYGWFALPLLPAGTSSAGLAAGDQSWTLFVHGANFKGPVGFFPPETWTAVHAADRSALGRGHDRMPASMGGVSLEIGFTAMFVAADARGVRYARIPRMTFAADASGQATLIQDVRYYPKAAIWDPVAAWINTGRPATSFGQGTAFTPSIEGNYYSARIAGSSVTFDSSFSAGAMATADGRTALGLRWRPPLEAGVFPEYFVESGGGWSPVGASQVPPETQLAQQRFGRLPTGAEARLNTAAGSPWAATGWAAGPFKARLGDGSTVEYVWYRFVDQPAIARLGLSAATLQRLQALAETMHETYGASGASFAPPVAGALATLDAAVLVTPPAGLEKGFVPIAVRQYATGDAPRSDFSDLWWNANESGWGLSFTQHGVTGFAAWYVYDDTGRPLWVVMPGGTWTSASTFTGDLYTTSGPDPRGAFDPALVVPTRVGSGTLTFSSFEAGTLSYQVNGIAHSRPISRQPFGPRVANAAGKPNYGDLWWNAAESGWGLSITQQNHNLFAAWYIYDPDRQPAWYVMPEGRWTNATTWTGPLYRTRAAALPFFSGAYNASGVVPTLVGTLELRFASPQSATMTYTIDGVTGSKAITRQSF